MCVLLFFTHTQYVCCISECQMLGFTDDTSTAVQHDMLTGTSASAITSVVSLMTFVRATEIRTTTDHVPTSTSYYTLDTNTLPSTTGHMSTRTPYSSLDTNTTSPTSTSYSTLDTNTTSPTSTSYSTLDTNTTSPTSDDISTISNKIGKFYLYFFLNNTIY